MNKRVLRINSYILNIISLLLVFFTTGYLIGIFIIPSTSSWKFIGMLFMIFVTLGIYAGALPMLISGTGTLNYLKGKDNYKFCKSVASIVVFPDIERNDSECLLLANCIMRCLSAQAYQGSQW